MDALAPTTTTVPTLQVRPPAPRGAAPPEDRPTPPPSTPAPSLEAPPLPLLVQRDQLRPPVGPLMSGEQMSALLQVLLGGAGAVTRHD